MRSVTDMFEVVDIKLGLILNFNTIYLGRNIVRAVNNL